MSETTGISWAHSTHNLWWGCAEVSPACDRCYAKTLSRRYGFDVWGLGNPRRFFKAAHYDEPLRWNANAERAGERRRVFCGSMMDIAEKHPDPQVNARMGLLRRDLFERVIPQTPWLDWLLLTKRPSNFPELVPEKWMRRGWPLNAWPGITAEDQNWLDIRMCYLQQLPARVLWVSYEPALGPLDLAGYIPGVPSRPYMRSRRGYDAGCPTSNANPARPIGWLIAGGESGAGFREPLLEWYRSARDQCVAAGVKFFFKQHAGLHPKLLGDRLDGRQWHGVPEARP